jgi:glutamate racemase
VTRSQALPRRIGIMDWGIGGLGFWQLLKRAEPGAECVYLSDSGAPPYGTLPARVLAQRVQLAIDWFAQRAVTHVVVACNAASSVLTRVPPARLVRTLGVIEPTLRTLLAGPRCRIGIFGGRRTIRSHAYRSPLAAAGFEVQQRIAQPLSALVEAGRISGPGVEGQVERILRPIASCDLLVPACTHYVALLPLFQQIAPTARFVDPAQLTLKALRAELQRATTRAHASRRADEFWTTGSPAAFQRGAAASFGVEVTSCGRLRGL